MISESIEFLGSFSRRDAIHDDQFELAPDSDTVTSNSENENEYYTVLFHRINLSLSFPNIFFFSKSDF